MQEQRAFVRVSEAAEGFYTHIPYVRTIHFFTQNISQAGAHFFVHGFLPHEKFLTMRFVIKNIPLSFQVVAEIIWVKERDEGNVYEVGVKFTQIPKEVQTQLRTYMQSEVRKIRCA